MDILMKIQKDYLNFSRQERKIADYILRFSDSIKNMKISELAERTETSNASITRFVKKIGCENYPDLKLHLKDPQDLKVESHTKGIADDVFMYYQNVIKNTQRLIEPNQIKYLIKRIKKAKKIIILGSSNSGVTANIFGVRLMRMGLPVESYSDPVWMLMNASISGPDDLYIAISNSGITESIIKTITTAKENQAYIVSMTSFSENPIADLSDLVFHVYNPRFVNNEKFANSQFSNIYLIDVITTYLLEDDKFREKMFTTREIIGDV